MKVDFKSNENQRQIANVRSQIKVAGDLKSFDEFLTRHNSFDFNNQEQVQAAKACCSGENCCKNITVGFSAM